MKDVMTEKIEGQSESRCPFSSGNPSTTLLEIDDELFFPQYKRVFHQYRTDASGMTELHLDYSDKEISFDEPELFAFGEQLVKQERFVAGTATKWGKGYSWTRIRELLKQLIEEGVLSQTNTVEAGADAIQAGSRPSQLPKAKGTVPRTWFECEAITGELTDHAIELSYLELVIPVFRIAHIALDTEGRQVGEANVFPKALRLDIATDWRACIHAGSRYQDERPMNVTALKSMRRHWPQMMTVLRHIREGYLQRFPKARNGWTVGDLERLSSLVLAVPAYLLMRMKEPVENGKLHPVLSCTFRVTDGVRMTMHQMLFSPVLEPTLPPDAAMTGSEIYAYAERNNSFFSEYGVCAGSKTMIEEFLRVFVDGQINKDAEMVQLEPEIINALSMQEQAIDYCFYGLQAHAVVFSLWPLMARTSEKLWAILEHWTDHESEQLNKFRNRIQDYVKFLRTETMLGTEEWRISREVVYTDMYDQCAKGLTGKSLKESLANHLETIRNTNGYDETQRLSTLLCRRFFEKNKIDNSVFDNLISVLMDYFCAEQAIVCAASEIQQQINHLLGRNSPSKPLQVSAFDVFNQLQDDVERLPYFGNELEEALGINIIVTKDNIEFSDQIYFS